MTKLILITDDIKTMSSREIAQITGKNHQHVLRDCDNLNDGYSKLQLPKLGQLFSIRQLPNGGSVKDRYFELTKIQCFDLLTGYSQELRIKVNRRWEELERKEQKRSNNLPYHLRRYMINHSAIPPTHFSIFNEIVYNLIAPLENYGYELPDSLIPDISEGRMFANWVREEKGLEPNNFPTYTHTYPEGRIIPNVKLYPNFLLGDFREHFYNVWMKEKAIRYFEKRDKNAIPFLKKALPQFIEVNKISA